MTPATQHPQQDPYKTQMDRLVEWKYKFIKCHGYYPNINDVWNKIDQIRRCEKERASHSPAQHPQPPYEMHDAYILKKEDWLRLRENLTIGCTNQKAFLDTLTPCASHSAQQRIEQVIKELEKEIVDQKDLVAHTEGHHKEIHESILNALQYSIALLQAEVPK